MTSHDTYPADAEEFFTGVEIFEPDEQTDGPQPEDPDMVAVRQRAAEMVRLAARSDSEFAPFRRLLYNQTQ